MHLDDYGMSSGSFLTLFFFFLFFSFFFFFFFFFLFLQNYSQMELGILKLAAVLIIGEYNL